MYVNADAPSGYAEFATITVRLYVPKEFGDDRFRDMENTVEWLTEAIKERIEEHQNYDMVAVVES
mgnify:CR=1 FL=1